MKDPVMERNINQFRDGSLNLKFGKPSVVRLGIPQYIKIYAHTHHPKNRVLLWVCRCNGHYRLLGLIRGLRSGHSMLEKFKGGSGSDICPTTIRVRTLVTLVTLHSGPIRRNLLVYEKF